MQTKQSADVNPEAIAAKMKGLIKPIVTKDDIKQLETVEAEEAEEAKKHGLEEFKFASNEEMLQAMGLTETA